MGIIDLKDKVVDLLVEKLNDRVALSDHCITLIDLILPVKNGLLSCSDNFLLLCHQSLKLLYLGDLSVLIPIVTLHDTGQLTHTAA
jgi:hypothetical protein